jgi:protein disulfide-isomerase
MKIKTVSFCAISLAVVAVFSMGAQVSAGDIKWSKSFDEAFAAAKKENKPVMIAVYTDWAVYCGRLEREVYTEDKVVKLSEKFICLKLNPEQDKEHGALFKVAVYPTIIFTDPNRKELSRIVGGEPAEKFAAQMNMALKAFESTK